MEYKDLSIKEIHEAIIKKEIKISELVKKVIDECKKNEKFNFLVSLIGDDAIKKAIKLDKNIDVNNFLYGIPYIAKDNIWALNTKTTACCKILENFNSPENSTVINNLDDANSILVGKATLDELAMGGTGLFACNGHITNPYDSTRIIGGSSSGSTYAVAKKIVPFAIGTDTGDSIRKPASYAGVVGFKPTYGSISRYGVMPYAPSLDHVGFLTRNVEDLKYICQSTFKYDKRDFTSIDNGQNFFEKDNKTKKIFGYFSDVKKFTDKKIWNKYEELFDSLKKDGHEIKELNFRKDLLDSVAYLYMIISFSEAVSTWANLDGINFGQRVEGKDFVDVMKNSRTNGFGDIVKKRFIIGSYQLKRENQIELLDKAKRIRRLIKNEMENVYKQIDFLVVPPAPGVAPKIKDVLGKSKEDEVRSESNFLNDILIMSNFTGEPSITLPFITENNLPIGININAKIKNDKSLLLVSEYIESKIKEMKNREVK